jgi:ABC-type oligopeptide transport system substrate-binding subunit
MRLVAVAVTVALATGCGLPDGEYFGDVPSLEGRDLKHFRWCNSGEPETLDPALATTTTAIKLVYALFDGLYAYDANGLPEPSIATSTDQTSDLRRFTFHLRTDAKWTNGRSITAYDFAYHIQRVLHPTTASSNGDNLFTFKNAEEYLGSRVRVVLADVPGLAAGTIVEVISANGKTGGDLGGADVDANLRRSSRVLGLRDLGAAEADSYARVPAGSTVKIIEISGRPGSLPDPAGGGSWAYVYLNRGDGVFGWVPLAELDVAPNDDVAYWVRPVTTRYIPEVDATPDQLIGDDLVARPIVPARGKDLLILPEALGVRVPDPYTLVIETKSPTPYMLNLANQRAMRASPREAVARKPRRWAEPDGFVGSGGLRLVAWKERDHIEMVKSETFWNSTSVKIDRLTAFSIADQAAITNYYFTGGCDATTSNPVPATYMPVMNGEKRGGVPYKDFVVVPWNAVYFPLVNAEKFPNRHFRRALAYATDRDPVVKILKGGQIPSAQLSPGRRISDLSDAELALCEVTRDTPGLAMIMITGELCYVPPPGLDHDPEKARQEIAIARKEMGATFPSSISYRYNAGSEAHKLIAELLQSQWQRTLGISVRIESQEWKTMVADATAGNYETMGFGAQGNFPDTEAEFLPVFKCTNPDNRPQWCNKEFDAVLEAASRIADRKERLKLIYQAEKIAVEDAAIIPLYTYTQQFLIRPYVRDLAVNLVDVSQIERMWIDPDWKAHEDEARR